MLQDNTPGVPEVFIGEAKPEEKPKPEDKKTASPTLKPPEEFIYDPVKQDEH